MPHIHEKVDYTVEVFVIYKNRVLLRKHDKYGIWMSVGGHIELAEDPVQAALREVREEVGLEVKLVGDVHIIRKNGYQELLPPRFLNRHRISDSHEHVTLTYFAQSSVDTITQGHDERSEAIRWFTEEELRDPAYGIEEHIQYYALAALKTAAG